MISDDFPCFEMRFAALRYGLHQGGPMAFGVFCALNNDKSGHFLMVIFRISTYLAVLESTFKKALFSNRIFWDSIQLTAIY